MYTQNKNYLTPTVVNYLAWPETERADYCASLSRHYFKTVVYPVIVQIELKMNYMMKQLHIS